PTLSRLSSLFLFVLPQPPLSPLFPYTTLFRSRVAAEQLGIAGIERVERQRRGAATGFVDGALACRDRPSDVGRNGRPEHGCLLLDRKSTRLNSSHVSISYAVFCLKKKRTNRVR